MAARTLAVVHQIQEMKTRWSGLLVPQMSTTLGRAPSLLPKLYKGVRRYHSSETLDWENALTGANAEGESDPLKRRSDRAGNDSRRKHIVRSVYVCYPLSHSR